MAVAFPIPQKVDIRRFGDDRGVFTKPWTSVDVNHTFIPKELYISTSNAGAFRGLHGQSGEHSQGKFLTAIHGRIVDFCLDVRFGSPTYGTLFRYDLDSSEPQGLFVPRGFMHGFYSVDSSTILNICDNDYRPEFEVGVNPLSFQQIASLPDLILSEKDRALQYFESVT